MGVIGTQGSQGSKAQQRRAGRAGSAQGALASRLERETAPLRNELVEQSLEALRTGGLGAQLPIAQQGIERAKLGTADAIERTKESLAQAGLAGSSFGESTLADLRLRGGLAAREAELGPARAFIAGAPQLASAGTVGALQGLSGAAGTFSALAGISGQREAAENQTGASVIGSILGGTGGAK